MTPRAALEPGRRNAFPTQRCDAPSDPLAFVIFVSVLSVAYGSLLVGKSCSDPPTTVHGSCQSQFGKSLHSYGIMSLGVRRFGPVCPRAEGVRQFVAEKVL